jgi:uncharacterized protein (TIGR02271 family)
MATNFNEIQAGWTAYDEAGEKIGEVADLGQGYLLVQKGLFFPKDLYIPMSSVAEVDASDQAVTIVGSKNDVESYGWDSPPTEDTGWATGDGSIGATTAGTDLSARDAYATDDTYSTTNTTGMSGTSRTRSDTTATDDSFTVPLREEQLSAQRREREAGEVAVGKHVVEQEQVMDVPVTHEEVDITRRRVDRPADASDQIIDDGETIRVPLRAEEVDVRKDARVVEEVEISKRPVTETQRVSETVRREEIDVDAQGDVLTGAGASRTQRANLDDTSVSRGGRLTDDESDDPYRS